MTNLELAVHAFTENLSDLILQAKAEATAEFDGAKRSLEREIAGLEGQIGTLEDQLALKDQELDSLRQAIAAFQASFTTAFATT